MEKLLPAILFLLHFIYLFLCRTNSYGSSMTEPPADFGIFETYIGCDGRNIYLL
jgi:hypothetical protein